MDCGEADIDGWGIHVKSIRFMGNPAEYSEGWVGAEYISKLYLT